MWDTILHCATLANVVETKFSIFDSAFVRLRSLYGKRTIHLVLCTSYLIIVHYHFLSVKVLKGSNLIFHFIERDHLNPYSLSTTPMYDTIFHCGTV